MNPGWTGVAFIIGLIVVFAILNAVEKGRVD